MDRYHVEHPGELKPDEAEATLKLASQKGDEHEHRYVEALRTSGRDVWEPPSALEPVTATLSELRAGRDVIVQGALKHGSFAGRADILERVALPSSLGNFSYTISDTKLAKQPKPYFVIQLCAYAEMLAGVQGMKPQTMSIILGSGELRNFKTEDHWYYYLAVKAAFEAFHEAFDAAVSPIPDGGADHGRWQSAADARLIELDDLSLVAGLSRGQRKKLRAAGIATCHALSQSCAHVPKLDDQVLARLAAQARLQIASRGLATPAYELIAEHPESRGLSLLPPASTGDVFFDMEGYPFAENGHEYLFGAVSDDNGQRRFTDFWAYAKRDEKRAFEAFIDWVFARYQRDPKMHIYHYANYEVAAVRRLMGTYATREDEVDALLRGQVFVDLLPIVRRSVRIGEPRYSLKNVEHLYRAKREGEVSTAGDSVAEFARWLAEPDGSDWRVSKVLQAIREYNRADCESTAELAAWLRERQREAGIAWQLPPPKNAIPDAPSVGPTTGGNPSAALAHDLRAAIPAEQSADAERWRIQSLLADLLEFHRREDKPRHWARYDRAAMTDEERYDDLECLAGLRRTKLAPLVIKRSTGYEYAFDPNQDTKITAGNKCRYAHDVDGDDCTVHALDLEAGHVVIKLGPNKPAPPAALSLIHDDMVSAAPIANSILRTVTSWKENGALPKAFDDFLRRRPPAIDGHVSGASLKVDGKDQTTWAVELAAKLNNSTLSIQGPPGAGKTHTAAHMIVRLLRNGHKVGVTSNGHHAIAKLMIEVMDLAASQRASVAVFKIGDEDKSADLVAKGGVTFAKAITAFVAQPRPVSYVVGGTAWAFSAADAVGMIDYLFVDEAGQVSLANLLGMAPSARNLVLLGDQMQLGQPIQGSHPGESGQSLLEYLMQGHQTAPDHLGLFLATTHRLHPKVCAFISETYYEGKLRSEPGTEKRVLKVPAVGSLVPFEAGVVFVPCEHEGNAQASDEEVEKVRAIIGELVGRELLDRNGVVTRRLSLSDILVVAPFNMQVRRLKEALGPAAHVGSVDKFQGQGKPVVVLSMCTSGHEPTPRGIEFLFSPNRLNVAISRAETLAIVVGDPRLSLTSVSNVDQIPLLNGFCRLALA